MGDALSGAIKLAESWPTRFVSSDLPASGGKANSGEGEIPQVTAGLSQNWHKWNRYANKPLREVAEKDQVTQWREYLSGRLPDYMTPTAYVMLDALPLTPNGKLDRKALPAPDMRKAEGRNGYPAPETPLEQIVVGIFEEVLKLDRVGRKDNFFELGGHSLLATQVISRVRKMSGVDLGVRSVFESRRRKIRAR